MNTKLAIIETDVFLPEEKNELDSSIDRIIESHKNNRQAINRLVFESVAAMAEGDEYEHELSNKGWFKSTVGNFTGSNKKLQDKINSSRAAVQYAAQCTLQKLAEQNLMTFDLITAVNNKLNISMYNVEGEINNIYSGLTKFFKQNRSKLLKIDNELKKLERNVNLLNWQNSIEYQMLDGVEYPDLDDIGKLVCLARDFLNITDGKWNTSDLLLLKSAMSDIGISPKAQLNYFTVLKAIDRNDKLKKTLLGGKLIKNMEDSFYLIPVSGLKKLETLKAEEKYIVDSVAEMVGQEATNDVDEIRFKLADKYLQKTAKVNPDVEVQAFDFLAELLFSVQQATDEGLLYLPDDEKRGLFAEGENKSNEIEEEESESTASDLKIQADILYYQDKKYTEALEKYQELYEHGNKECTLEIGKIYYLGDGVEKNTEEALKYFKLAAEANVVEANTLIGDIYAFEKNNNEEALKYYTIASKSDDALAFFRMGCLYELGRVKNPFIRHSYEITDLEGLSDIAAGLSDMVTNIVGGRNNETPLTSDMSHLSKLLSKFSRPYLVKFTQNEEDVKLKNGQIINGISLDFEKAKEYYQKSADLGYMPGYCCLGLIHSYSSDDDGRKPIEGNEKFAFECYQKAAKAGDDWGELLLAIAYITGNGNVDVKESYSLFEEWLTKSAKQGNAFAKKLKQSVDERNSDWKEIDEGDSLSS